MNHALFMKKSLFFNTLYLNRAFLRLAPSTAYESTCCKAITFLTLRFGAKDWGSATKSISARIAEAEVDVLEYEERFMRKITYVGFCAVLSASAAAQGASPSTVAPSRRLHHVHASPSDDAVRLRDLAPPSRRSTVEQTYGDAVFARARHQRTIAVEPVEGQRQTPFAIDPCEPRIATASGYRCLGDPETPGYGRYYAFLPANASAPQVPRGDPGAQASVLAPATTFFWAVNSLRFDPHN